MKVLVSHVVALHLEDLYTESDLGFRKSCWLCYGLLPVSSSLLLVDILSTVSGALLWLTMGYSGWRQQQSSGTIYESHFRNLFLCAVLPFCFLAVYGILLGSATGLAHAGLLAVLAAAGGAGLYMFVHGVMRLVQYKEADLLRGPA